jgi:hypothetical protein
MRKLSFMQKIFLGVGVTVLGTVPSLVFGDDQAISAFAGLGGLFAGASCVAWAILEPIINGVRRLIAGKAGEEERLRLSSMQAAADAKGAELARMTAPMVLAAASGNRNLSSAAEAFTAARSAWQRAVGEGGDLDQQKLRHAIRSIEESCQNTLADPMLANSAAAHQQLAEIMAKLARELVDDLKEAEVHRLQDLSINLTVLERQVIEMPVPAYRSTAAGGE